MSWSIPRKPVANARAPYSYATVESQENHVSQSSDHAASQPTPTSPILLTPLKTQPAVGVHESSPEHSLLEEIAPASSDDEHDEKLETITSQWKVDWKTSTILLASYSAALGAAVGHLAWFLKLDGTHVAEYHIPQGYITTVSTLIATVWSLCLSICLSGVFTQSLWNLLRRQYTPVGQIETLYSLLGNVLNFRPKLLVSSPILYAIAIFTWSLPFLKSLPPGSLTVDFLPFSNSTDVTVPTFSSSYIGSGSYEDLSLYMPGQPRMFVINGDSRVTLSPADTGTSLEQSMRFYFRTGELPNYKSPCGANCSVVLKMEAPYLDCKTRTYNTTLSSTNNLTDSQNNQILYDLYRSSYSINALTIQTFQPIDVFVATNSNSSGFRVINNQTLARVNETTCNYATAIYTVDTSFVNGIQNITYSTQPLAHLDFTSTCGEDLKVGPLRIVGVSCRLTQTNSTGKWLIDETGQKAMIALKSYGMMQYMFNVLKGSIPLTCTLPDTPKNGRNPLNCGLGVVIQGSTPLTDTFFYGAAPNQYTSGEPGLGLGGDLPNLRVSPEVLNAALFNVTMTYVNSVMNFQNTTTTATQTWVFLTFKFSRRLNLILPYFIGLGLAVPAVAYALVLLYHDHHVAAIGDSFVQILMTTATGSPALAKVAAGGCLGGDNNVPKELKELKIKYGDITKPVGDDEPELRLAGFGVEGEVTPLRRRAVYGSAGGGGGGGGGGG